MRLRPGALYLQEATLQEESTFCRRITPLGMIRCDGRAFQPIQLMEELPSHGPASQMTSDVPTTAVPLSQKSYPIWHR